MPHATFKVTVYGDTHSEIVDKAEDEICSFLEISENDISQYANYELIIEKDESFEAEYSYKADVIARIK